MVEKSTHNSTRNSTNRSADKSIYRESSHDRAAPGRVCAALSGMFRGSFSDRAFAALSNMSRGTFSGMACEPSSSMPRGSLSGRACAAPSGSSRGNGSSGASSGSDFAARLASLMDICIGEMRAIGIEPSRQIFAIRENRRAKKRLGCCKVVRERGRTGFVIEVSSIMERCSDEVLKDVIFHELLHTCPGCLNHGQKWKSLADRINRACGSHIRVRADSSQIPGLPREEEEPQYKYEIECAACGIRFYRMRRSRVVDHPEYYRCSRCGGRLRVRELSGVPAGRHAGR